MSAHPPAQPPPPFPEPVLHRARRVPGFVEQPPKPPSKTKTRATIRKSMSNWSSYGGVSIVASNERKTTKGGTEGGDQNVIPTKPGLERKQSVSGNILLIEPQSSNVGGGGEEKEAYLMHRKIRQSEHGTIRIGFGLRCPTETDGGWEVKPDTTGIYPFMMYAIKIQLKEQTSLIMDESENDYDSSDDSGMFDHYDGRHGSTDQAALQWIANHDPEMKGFVLGSCCMASDNHHLYTITQLHREGTLLDFVGQKGTLTERQARFFFKQILQGLQTLKQMEICHRNLSLDSVMLRGHTCTIGNLGAAIRIPTNTDTGMVHLIEPQPPSISQPPQYMAPELFRQDQPFDGYAVDLWAASIMLFIMLLGMDYLFTAPMQADPRFKEICIRRNLHGFVVRYQQQRRKADEGGGDSGESAGPILSDDAMSLLQSLLLVEARDRLTLSGAMEHPWVQTQDEEVPS